MPQFSGLRALELVQKQRADVPVIIVSGNIGEFTMRMPSTSTFWQRYGWMNCGRR